MNWWQRRIVALGMIVVLAVLAAEIGGAVVIAESSGFTLGGAILYAAAMVGMDAVVLACFADDSRVVTERAERKKARARS